MNNPNIVTACLLIIGDEILSGRTRDANLSHIAKWLNAHGIQLMEARVIPDDETEIVTALNECRRKFGYVFTTGGIGPTHDDITADCVARAFDVPLEQHAEAVARMEERVGKTGLTRARLRMTRVPRGGILIDNPVSAAPGFQIENVFVLAGIPTVMKGMLDTLSGRLIGGSQMLSRTIHAFTGESLLAGTLKAVQDDHNGLQIGSYPFYHDKTYGANLVLRARDHALLDTAVDDLKTRLAAEGIKAFDGEALEKGH